MYVDCSDILSGRNLLSSTVNSVTDLLAVTVRVSVSVCCVVTCV